jgi:rubrerythrin
MDLMSKTGDQHMKNVLEKLAKEELKHKNRLQAEYDDVVMRWN